MDSDSAEKYVRSGTTHSTSPVAATTTSIVGSTGSPLESAARLTAAAQKDLDTIAAGLHGKLRRLLFQLLRNTWDRPLTWKDIDAALYESKQAVASVENLVIMLGKDISAATRSFGHLLSHDVRIRSETQREIDSRKCYRLEVTPKRQISLQAAVEIDQQSTPAHFHEFTWGQTGSWERSVKARVAAISDLDLEITIAPRGLWPPPSGLDDYPKASRTAWQTYRKQALENRRHRNSEIWSAAGIAIGSSLITQSRAVCFDVLKTTYKDYIATNGSLTDKSSDFAKFVATSPAVPQNWHPYPSAANPLAIELLPITSDGQVVLFKRHKSGDKGVWLETVHGWIDAVLDGHRTSLQLPNPNETAFRLLYEWTGVPLIPAFVKWMGVAVGSKFGIVSLLGECSLPFSAGDVAKMFAKRPMKKSATDLYPRPLDPALIHQAAKKMVVRPVAEAAIATLIRRHCGAGSVNILHFEERNAARGLTH